MFTLFHISEQGFCLYIDSKGSQGFLTALAPHQRSVIDSKYVACFRCTIVVDKLKPEPAPSVSDQQVSAEHYNKLDRTRVFAAFHCFTPLKLSLGYQTPISNISHEEFE